MMTEIIFAVVPLVVIIGSRFLARMPMKNAHKIRVSYD
ncbi:hypothetical protein ApDm4_2188 [Acetobacter pomorum]|nr:hypothetical protein ApDm4_2188 [Acetobacter pomorum]